MKEYVVVLDAKHPVTTFKEVDTDSFEEVEQFVSQFLWTYTDGVIEVYRRQKDGNHIVIKRIIIKK